ncbi:DOPA-like domain-containing protein [Pterulicium gracile]|uniref:DOPA-like domain-containing protein n=1 Tax=Pterulicium gracile TaxID=1884261 RepID=A0A5C3QXN1_9AGAR|nr:DOPA-like domain-containing protein [Pterula gracilis]
MFSSPLTSIDTSIPLPTGTNSDGKSLKNLDPGSYRSGTYDHFPTPIDERNNAFDFHIYYMPSVPAHAQYARELHERIRREFPELRIYKFWENPVGPHPTAIFEVNTFSPHQTGALFGFLTVFRGPCSVLIHPNTDNAHKDHTELATWMGKPWPLNEDMLKGE